MKDLCVARMHVFQPMSNCHQLYVEVTAISLETPGYAGLIDRYPIENKQPGGCMPLYVIGYFSTSMMCSSIQLSSCNFAMYIVHYFSTNNNKGLVL